MKPDNRLVHGRRQVRSHVHASTHVQNLKTRAHKLAVPTSLSNVQSHMLNRNFAVANAPLVTVNFAFHNSALSCSILNETFDIQQKILCTSDTQILDRT